jgi:hypothetical protein
MRWGERQLGAGVVSGFGKALSFEHVFPTIVDK